MTWLCDSSELVDSGWLSSAYEGHGITGVAIPSTGSNGPSLLFGDPDLPTENLDEFYFRIVTVPSGLTTFRAGEAGDIEATGPDGTYNGTYQGFKNGISYGFGGFSFSLGDSGIIRDMNQSFSGKRLCTTPFVGVLGSTVPSTGDDGPGYLYNDLVLPEDNSNYVRGFVTTFPTSGTFLPNDDSSFTYSGGDPGVNEFIYEYRLNDVVQGSATGYLTVEETSFAEIIANLDDIAISASASTSTAAGISETLEDIIISSGAQVSAVTGISETLEDIIISSGAQGFGAATSIGETLEGIITSISASGFGASVEINESLESILISASASGFGGAAEVISNLEDVTSSISAFGFAGAADLSITLDDSVLSSSATGFGNATSIAATLEGVTFEGSASGFGGAAEASVILGDTVFSGNAIGFGNSASADVTLEDTSVSSSAFGFSGGVTLEINLDNSTFNGSASAFGGSTSVITTLDGVNVSSSAAGAQNSTGFSINLDGVTISSSVVGGGILPGDSNINLDDVDVYMKVSGSMTPMFIGRPVRLPIPLGIGSDGKLIIYI